MKKKLLLISSNIRLTAALLTGFLLILGSNTKAANWYVNDGSLTGNVFTTAVGNNSNLGTAASPFLTISHAVIMANNGDVIFVDAGMYEEDVLVNKSVTLTGAGINKSIVWGVKNAINPSYATFWVTASNVIIQAFTISRSGNNVTEWNDGLNIAGVGLQNISNATIRNNQFTDNRTAIDIIGSNGCSIHNNVIDFNRTGMFIHDQCQNNIIKENFITNCWAIGVLSVSSGINDAIGTKFYNNKISDNWYTQIENRNENGGIKDFSSNWLGTCTPTTAVSPTLAELDYASLIPVAYGGTGVRPTTGMATIRGNTALALSQIDYTPWLKSPADMDINNGTGTIGFQGNFSTSTTNANAGPNVTLYNGYGPECATLTASGPPTYSYSWNNGCNTKSIKVCPDHTTKYTVTVTDNNGCLTKSSDKVTVVVIDVRCNTGRNSCGKNDKDDEKVLMCNGCKVKCVKEKDVEKYLDKGYDLGPCSLHKVAGETIEDIDILISPNPFSGSFNLTYASISDLEADIKIYDMSGKLVQHETLTGFFNEVHLGELLSEGLYSVIFTQGETRKTFRVIKSE